MSKEPYISISDFCRGHSLEEQFLFELHEFELIRIVKIDRNPVIRLSELERLERLVRLHRDLEIGPQGLQAVQQLLERVDRMQEEILQLRRRLGRWENR